MASFCRLVLAISRRGNGLQGTTLRDHLNTYDIWCMYHKNLCIRHLQLPSALQFDFDSVTLDRAVPKFHLNAHGVGHTDGEGIERDWASVNGAARSTKEMGEGLRHDTLNDIWGDMNYRKFIAMGSLLPKKLQNAIIQCEKHNEQHEIFCGAIPDTNKVEWTTMINEWENDKSKPDPYVIETIFQSQAAIRLELVAAEHASLGINEMELMQPSPSAFISSGLDIEEAQRGLSFEVHKLKSLSTDTQKANVEHYARAAYLKLQGSGAWEQHLCELKQDDIHPMVDHEEEPDKTARQNHRLGPHENEEMHSALRVEWAKSLAWKHQWAEEVAILQEEMHQVVAYSKWRATWWEEQVNAHVGLALDLQEGLRAYAVCQSSIYQGCATLFQKQWAIPDAHAADQPPETPDWVDLNPRSADDESSANDEHYL
ncbi:hypothetical protein BS47DRAFT_1401889 [Hydnum rufescens UP504]|uniref:Uncharacterized protein n=1 Tax=Hydnum rufescens UP504 TaxID=1448309 RepID=A0A9P6AE09_9AGAM|nr:hypothetical protein BS47DRAFT_1401889 [Hydnum rufescens UP504]